MDLADTETPIKFESEVAASFPALEQDANINYDNGRYEVVFATYKATETTISSVALVMPTMQSVKAKIQGINQSLTELSSAEGITNSEQSNIATFDTSSWDDGAYLIFNYYVGAGSFFELLIKRGSNIAITNLTKKSTVNGTVVTMEVGNFWCLLLRKCIYR